MSRKCVKIQDQSFRVPMTSNRDSDMVLEFYICETNELNPYREIKELGVVLFEKDESKRNSDSFRQLDNSNDFGVEEIDILIKYLQKAKKHIKKFNESSKPKEINNLKNE